MSIKAILGLTSSDLERFWSKVDTNGDCWTWIAGLVHDGYGRFWLNGSTYRANRVSYFIQHDIDPGEELVCHTCDNPGCVRPDHLWLGSDRDNRLDCIQKDRDADRRGSKHGASKLTEKNVEAILTSSKSQVTLAQQYGISAGIVSEIQHGKRWQHVEGNRRIDCLNTRNTTGVRGVSLCTKTGRYAAELQFEKKRYRLGRFDTIAEAGQAVIIKRRELTRE